MIHEAEFDAFIRRHHRRLWGFAYFLTRDAHDAEELMQDALERIVHLYWDDRLAKRSEGERIRYVLATVASQHKNLVRRRTGGLLAEHRHGDMDQLSSRAGASEADPSVLVVELDNRHCISTYLSTLNPVQARVVWLRAVEGYSVREVAAMLDMTDGNVKSTCSRALQKIKKALCEQKVGDHGVR